MGAAQLRRILGPVEDVIDFGLGINVKVRAIVSQHRHDTGAPDHFVIAAHVGQVILIVVTTNPRQPVKTQGFQGWHRTARQPQGVDVIRVEVPTGIEHVFGFFAVGTDASIDLSTLGQAH
ncbi:hypothetical protein D3C76_1568950 [compost metagenome]